MISLPDDPHERALALSLAPRTLSTPLWPLLEMPVTDPRWDPLRAWLRSAVGQRRWDSERRALEALGAWTRTPADPQWPVRQRGVIRGVGAVPAGPLLAIVGARRADPYGLELAARVARAAVAQGWGVISGGAVGVDLAAHEATMAAGGQTVAVLGGGLDQRIGGARGRILAQMRSQGALISPFPCGLAPRPWVFLARNRWIAEWASAVVVIQAGVRSGSLSTARAALKVGRPVWAAPGPLDHPLHQGCHGLMNAGARCLTDPGCWAPKRGQAALPLAEVEGPPGAEAKALWQAASGEPTALSLLGVRAGLPAAEAGALAVMLELSGWLRASPGGRYARATPREEH